MATKVHPKAFRLATIETWDSTWFSKGNFREFLREDVKIRAFLKHKLREAAVDKVKIDRTRQLVTVTIFTAKPGVIIGRQGSGVEELKKLLKNTFYRGRRTTVQVNVQDMGQGSLSAGVVAEQIAMDLEKRMPFRRVMKMAIDRSMKAGAQGVRVVVSGRLNGAEISRTERLTHGKVPLQNLRADIQYAQARANTLMGVIGVKVWMYRGEIFSGKVPDTIAVSERSASRSSGRDRERGARPTAPGRG